MFNFQNSGFGKVCHSEAEAVAEIIKCIKEKAVMNDEYKERVNEFFSFRDKNNCQRVYDEIIKL